MGKGSRGSVQLMLQEKWPEVIIYTDSQTRANGQLVTGLGRKRLKAQRTMVEAGIWEQARSEVIFVSHVNVHQKKKSIMKGTLNNQVDEITWLIGISHALSLA